MDKPKYVYCVQQPMAGATPEQLGIGVGWHTVAQCETPEYTGDMVRVLCNCVVPQCTQLRIEIQRVPVSLP